MSNQTTIKKSIRVNGVNVFNGNPNIATFHPARENSGIVFLIKGKQVEAKLEFAENRRHSICLDNGEQRVHLVEHLLSAVYSLGIDNLRIELTDEVCPTTDNCAFEYFEALKRLRKKQEAPRHYWRYAHTEGMQVDESINGKPDCLSVGHSEGFLIDYLAYYPHKVIGKQNYRFSFDENSYTENIANARPPGFLKNEIFKKAFLFLGRMGFHGINERNYLLSTSENSPRYVNPECFGVRHRGQEFVRHKVLDVLGTLALTGKQFKDSEFRFEMTGHRFDLYSLKRLFREGCFVDFTEKS